MIVMFTNRNKIYWRKWFFSKFEIFLHRSTRFEVKSKTRIYRTLPLYYYKILKLLNQREKKERSESLCDRSRYVWVTYFNLTLLKIAKCSKSFFRKKCSSPCSTTEHSCRHILLVPCFAFREGKGGYWLNLTMPMYFHFVSN